MPRRYSRRREPRPDRPYMPGYGMMFEKKRGPLPWSWAVKRLSTSHNYWLATSRPDGRPHVMPVWGIWLDNMFLFSTGRRSSKSRNLTTNPKCTVSPDGAAEAVILEGVAREVRETARLRRFASAYKKKYDWNIEGGKDPTYAVQPTVVFGLVETSDKIKGNPTRWNFASAKIKNR